MIILYGLDIWATFSPLLTPRWQQGFSPLLTPRWQQGMASLKRLLRKQGVIH
jgi:hypothetical protein